MIFFNKSLGKRPFSVILEHVGIMVPCIAIIAFSFILAPSDLEEGSKIIPRCMFKRVAGIPCPLCGMSRAFCSLSRGRFADAICYNPLSAIMYPLVAAGAVLPSFSLLFYLFFRRKD